MASSSCYLLERAPLPDSCSPAYPHVPGGPVAQTASVGAEELSSRLQLLSHTSGSGVMVMMEGDTPSPLLPFAGEPHPRQGHQDPPW